MTLNIILGYNIDMKIKRINKVLDLLIEGSYLAIVFLTPFYFSLFLKNANVFELNKIVLFKVLVLLLLFFTLIKIITNFKGKRPGFLFFSVYTKYLIIPLLFLLSFTVATFFSIDSGTSYYGLYERQQGLNSYIYYLLFFILLLINIRTKVQIDRIIIAAFLSSFLVCVYGLVQAAGFDPLNWTEPTSFRITSTFGQPNFLASYLLLVMPLGIYLFFISKKFLVKFLISLALFFQLLCLFFTYSRAGWLGLIVGLIFLGLIYLWDLFKSKKWSKTSLKYLFALGLLVIAVFIFLLSSNQLFKFRIKSLVDLKGGGVASRINYWQASIDAIKKRPIFGYGPETQGEIFVKYYNKDWAIYNKVNSYPNRAHNLFLDVLLTSGIIGLIAYLALLSLFFKLIIDNIKKNNHRLLSLAIFVSLVSYLVSLMFGFSVVTTDIYFWLYLAIIILLHSKLNIPKPGQKKEMTSIKDGQNRSYLFKLLAFIFILILGVATFTLVNKEIKRLIADHYFRELQIAWVNYEYFKGYVLYGYIKDQNIRDNYYDKYFSEMLANKLDDFSEEVLIRPGKEILNKMVKNINTNNYQDVFTKAKIYTALASEETPEFYSQAEDNFNNNIIISPKLPKSYLGLAKMHYQKKDYEKAIINYKIALETLPDLNNQYLNEYQHLYHKLEVKYYHYLINKQLGDVYLLKKMYPEAEEYYQFAYKNNPDDFTLYKKIANTYYLQNEIDMAIWYNKKGLIRNPLDYTWPYAIALLYKEKEDIELALEYAKNALKLEPGSKSIKDFIENIESLNEL